MSWARSPTLDEYLESESRRLKAKAEQGDFRAVKEAFLLFAWNGASTNFPMPEWLIDAVRAALDDAFRRGGAGKKGKTGGHLAKARRLDIAARRYSVADLALRMRRRGETREDAFARASESLAGTYAQGSPAAIKASYNRQRRLRNRA